MRPNYHRMRFMRSFGSIVKNKREIKLLKTVTRTWLYIHSHLENSWGCVSHSVRSPWRDPRPVALWAADRELDVDNHNNIHFGQGEGVTAAAVAVEEAAAVCVL